MNEEQMQQPNMTPDEAAASLSFATMLSEGLMPKVAPEQPQEAPQEPQTTPGGEETPELELDTTEEKTPDLEAKFDEFNEEVKILIKEGFENLKDDKDDDKADKKE
mgnify:CR=1 FL=1